MCKDIPNGHSIDAARGTVLHFISEQCLSRGFEPESYLEKVMSVILNDDGDEVVLVGPNKDPLFEFTIGEDEVRYVRTYVDAIRRETGKKFYEVAIDTSRVLGVPGQKGTADVAIRKSDELIIEAHDAKFGFHRVMAADNEQGILYLGGLLDEYDLLQDWLKGKFVIHQPKIGHYDEHTYTVKEIREKCADLADAGQLAVKLMDAPREEVLKHLVPGAKQCEWCPARASCSARANRVRDMFETLSGDKVEPGFLTDHDVADSFRRLDEIEGWCRDIRAEGLRRALAGKTLPKLKVVRGKRGNRAWADRKAAEAALMLLLEPDQMYSEPELITPTEAEKLLKTTYSAVADLVTQSEGGLSLVGEEDKRPAVALNNLEFQKL